jgi:hypothetical protein
MTLGLLSTAVLGADIANAAAVDAEKRDLVK